MMSMIVLVMLCECLPTMEKLENIFKRPDEAMLFGMVKMCLYLKIILLFRTLKDIFFL